MAAPIQSTAKCEVHSVINFINSKFVRPAEIHKKKIVALARAQRFPLASSPIEASRWEKVRRRWWGARRSHDVVQSAVGKLLWLWIQKLFQRINECLDNAGDYVEK